MENVKKRYSEKLLDPRWQKVKSTIQIRDHFACKKCGCKDSTLHVHHRHYLPLREPWDYPEALLVLLCAKCHKEEEQAADVIKEMAPALHHWGYFNTEIRDFVNKLIESKISDAKQNDQRLDSQQKDR